MGMSYIPVARAGELAAGAMKEVDLGGRAVLVTQVAGEYFAFTKECPHEGADLSAGGQLLDGAKIRCNNHSYCFDLHTGACLVPKGGAPLTVLPVEERDGEVCIKLEW
jgi:nitrite reductase/ring-hydroxylating ferredoxin subunit